MRHHIEGVVDTLGHKHVREYIGGVLMLLIGIGAAVKGGSYSIGTLSRMGPGFFPVSLGVIVALIGAVLLVGARLAPPESPKEVPPPELRGWLCIVLGVIAFGIIGRYGGLIPATFAIVFISALGERENTIKNALALAVLMVVFCLVVFAWALKIQFPVFRWA